MRAQFDPHQPRAPVREGVLERVRQRLARDQAEGDHQVRSPDRFVFGVAGDIGHKRPVDFDLAQWQAFQVAQAGVPGAKVVQRQLEAKAPVAVHATLQAQQIDFSVFDNFQRQL